MAVGVVKVNFQLQQAMVVETVSFPLLLWGEKEEEGKKHQEGVAVPMVEAY